MTKIPSPRSADTDQRAAARTFWFGVLGAVLGILGSSWLVHAIGLVDDMPPELDVFLIVVCVVAMLAFMFTHRNAGGTIQLTRSTEGATLQLKPPQGRRTALLMATTGALYWLLANLLHLSGNMLALAKIATCTTMVVLCTRYVLRSRKHDVNNEKVVSD